MEPGPRKSDRSYGGVSGTDPDPLFQTTRWTRIAATLRALDDPAHEARTHSQSFLHGGNSVALA